MVPPELLAALSDPNALILSQLQPLPTAGGPQPETRTITPRRVYFSREDDFFEDGDVHRHLYIGDFLTSIGEVEERSKVSEFQCQTAGCSQFFDTLESYELHYNTLHRNVCSTCKRSFPSGRLLDIHILEWHDALFEIMAEKSNMFQCLVEGCMEKFKSSGERKNHLIKTHLYPSDFRFDKPRKPKNKKQNERSLDKEVSMEVTPEDRNVESMEGPCDHLFWTRLCERIQAYKEKEVKGNAKKIHFIAFFTASMGPAPLCCHPPYGTGKTQGLRHM